MLIYWQFHQEYLYFLHEIKVHLDSSSRLHLKFPSVCVKLRSPNLDLVMEYLSAFYSSTDRPTETKSRSSAP